MKHAVKLLSSVAVTVLLAAVTQKPSLSKEPGKLLRSVTVQTKQADEPTSVLLEVEGVLEEGDAALSDGSLYDVYEFEGQAGQAITIRLESAEFDTYVLLTDADGERIAENDDVSASNTHSQLTVELTANGTYRIFANSYDETGRG